MFKHLVLAAAIAAPAFIFAAGAQAQGSPATGAKSPAPAASGVPSTTPAKKSGKPAAFDRLDLNRDGKLTRDEAKDSKRISARFDAIDANRDGVLSRDEVRAMAPKRTATPPKPQA
jgi:hypothetical protein